jgi:HSP20 family protein
MEFFPETRPEGRVTPFFRSPLRNIEETFNKMWPAFQNISPQPFALEVVELPESYIVKAFLPGIDRKCVDMWFDNLILTLKVEIEEEEEKKEATYLLRERFYGTTARSIQLPLADLKGNINATMKDGVLKIAVPKSHEKQTKKIEIH